MTTFIERKCLVTHNGRKFEAGGAVITPEYLIAYPDDGGVLRDWHGKEIGTYAFQTSRPAVFFGRRSWVGNTFYTMCAWVNGKTYTLRGFGVGMIAKGRAKG